MTFRAFVNRQDLLHRWVTISIADDHDNAYGADGKPYQILEYGLPDGFQPIVIPNGAVEAVYVELGKHLGIRDEPFARKDYEAERARVDKLTDVVVDVLGKTVKR